MRDSVVSVDPSRATLCLTHCTCCKCHIQLCKYRTRTCCTVQIRGCVLFSYSCSRWLFALLSRSLDHQQIDLITSYYRSQWVTNTQALLSLATENPVLFLYLQWSRFEQQQKCKQNMSRYGLILKVIHLLFRDKSEIHDSVFTDLKRNTHQIV